MAVQSLPTATRRSSGSLHSRPRPHGDELAAAHHPDRVAQAEELRQVGADEDDRFSGRGQAADDLVDLGLAADVDPAGGLVEEEDARRVLEQAGEGDLLLVAARELADRLVRAAALDRRARPSSGAPPPPGARG